LSYNDEFDSLAEEVFNHMMRWSPPLATYMGLHQFDKEMPSGSREALLEEVESRRRFLSRFEDIPRERLTGRRAIDRDIAIYGLKLQIFEDDVLRFWESLPDGVLTVGDALFPLFVREFTLFEERLKSIMERIKKSPRFLEETRSRIRAPVKLWVGIAEESSKNLPHFLEAIVSAAESKEFKELGELKGAVDYLKGYLKVYEEWLSDLMQNAREEFTIGRERFEDLLKLRGFDMDSGEILAFGEESLVREKRVLEELSRMIAPSSSVDEVKAKIKANHPSDFKEALKVIRETVQKARSLIVERGFATLPDGEELVVTETPSYLRHIISFAAYFSPAKFEERKIGIYVTTPPDGKPEVMEELNYASILNTAIHEGYPGHHLQLSASAMNPSLLRQLYQGPEFIEGWAHYCEEAMRDAGWADTLEARFMNAVDLVWRAARVVIDVKLSRGEMPFDEAVEFLMKETGMVKVSAIAEVKRYTYTPGYQLSYYLGKHMIKQLKEEAKKLWREKYSDRRFHDLLLNSAGLPLKFMKEVVRQSVTEGAP